MTCYHPITAWRSISGRGANGKWPLAFKANEGYGDLEVQIPCGKCIGCRLEQSRQWAIRCTHEASLHKENCFLTLTYDNYHLDPEGSLNKTDIQLFMKRLRKRFSNKTIRFFQCGEYGELYQRPHHHVILFGIDFHDKELAEIANTRVPLYTSRILSDLWPFGLHRIGNVTFESTAYVARYVVKKITGDGAEEHYQGRLPEYITMSRRPGIAHDWLMKYKDDVYPHDYVVIRNGIKCKPPAYYDKIYDKIQDEYSLNKIKNIRKREALKNPDFNNARRLLVKEKIQYLKADKLVRPLE